jgi:hypothetical protein
MTRRGHTPYLQSVFSTDLSIFVSRSAAGDDWELQSNFDFSGGDWDDRRFCYGPLSDQGFSRLKIEIKSVGPTKLEGYCTKDVDKELKFGVSTMSTSSRLRQFNRGDLKFDPKSDLLELSKTIELDLISLSGAVTFEPLVVACAELKDPRNSVLVTPGTVLGSSNLIRMTERPTEASPIDLFKFTWIDFREQDGYAEEELLDVDLDSVPPLIILNEAIPSFHHVMEQERKAHGIEPKKVRARIAMDSQIAVSVLETCGLRIIHKIRAEASIRRDDDPDVDSFGDIFEDMNTNEKQLILAFMDDFAITTGLKDGASFCHEIANANEPALTRHTTSQMPRNIRRKMKADTAISKIIDLAGVGNE